MTKSSYKVTISDIFITSLTIPVLAAKRRSQMAKTTSLLFCTLLLFGTLALIQVSICVFKLRCTPISLGSREWVNIWAWDRDYEGENQSLYHLNINQVPCHRNIWIAIEFGTNFNSASLFHFSFCIHRRRNQRRNWRKSPTRFSLMLRSMEKLQVSNLNSFYAFYLIYVLCLCFTLIDLIQSEMRW